MIQTNNKYWHKIITKLSSLNWRSQKIKSIPTIKMCNDFFINISVRADLQAYSKQVVHSMQLSLTIQRYPSIVFIRCDIFLRLRVVGSFFSALTAFRAYHLTSARSFNVYVISGCFRDLSFQWSLQCRFTDLMDVWWSTFFWLQTYVNIPCLRSIYFWVVFVQWDWLTK